MSKAPISVHILTWNSATTLRRTLESVKKAGEILVIDGGSTDTTLEIAREFGARILPQNPSGISGPISDFSAARNQGLRNAHAPWVLALDSDEIISASLWNELETISKMENEPTAFLVPRKYVDWQGTIIEYASTYPNERIYFFHRDAVIEWMKPVHERVLLKPNTTLKRLKGASLAPLPTIEEFKTKNLQYIAIEALRSTDEGWLRWFSGRLLHTCRSRLIALLRLAWIWLLPHRGKRLPLRHEMLRFWYAWKLIIETSPWRAHRHSRDVSPQSLQ